MGWFHERVFEPVRYAVTGDPYTGPQPGTTYEKNPKTKLGWASKVHDRGYDRYIRREFNPYTQTSKADDVWIEKNLHAGTLLSPAAAFGVGWFGLKRGFSDLIGTRIDEPDYASEAKIRKVSDTGTVFSNKRSLVAGSESASKRVMVDDKSFENVINKSMGYTRGILKPDGTSKGSVMAVSKKKKSFRRKKSLKKRIRALEKNIPVQSVQTVWDIEPLKLASGSANQASIFDIPVFTYGKYEAHLSALEGSDYTTVNSKIKVFNQYAELTIKNNMTSNCYISYVFAKCIDDDDESYVTNMRTDLQDRGITFSSAATAATASTATGAGIPYQQKLFYGEQDLPCFSAMQNKRKWKHNGPVTKVVIGPGDVLVIKSKIPDRLYKPEIHDAETMSYQKGDWSLIVRCQGDLVHDSTTLTKIAYGQWALDCKMKRRFAFKYPKGLGLNAIVMSNNFGNNTNLISAKHADNMASAMETDATS